MRGVTRRRRLSGHRALWYDSYYSYRLAQRRQGLVRCPGQGALPTMLRLHYAGTLCAGQKPPRTASLALVGSAVGEEGGPGHSPQALDADHQAPRTDSRRFDWIDQREQSYATEWDLAGPGNRPRRRRVAVVCGFRPGGIGAAVVRRLVLAGYIVICCDRNTAAAHTAVEAFRREGGEVWFIEADVSTEAGAQAVMDEVARRADRLDALVCNAGSAGDGKDDGLLTLTPEHLHRLIDDNLLSALLPCAAALRRFFLPQRFGSVVLLGSNNGQRGLGVIGQPGYGMAKAALSALLANLVAAFGGAVRFNMVRAGVVMTDSPNWRKRLGVDPVWARYEGCYTPSGRLGTPDDVARVVAFLAGSDSAWVNGAEVAVDGGVAAAGIQFPGWDPANFRESYVGAVKDWLANQPALNGKAA